MILKILGSFEKMLIIIVETMEKSRRHRRRLMVNILCARNRYIVPFMFCSETSYDKLVEEIAKNPLWNIQKMHEQKVEQDLYRMIVDCFEMDEKQNNIGCSFQYCISGNNILELNYTKLKEDFIVSVTDLGLYLFRSGVGLLWYEVSLPQGVTADEMMLFQNEFKELSYERFVSKRRENDRYTFEQNENRNTAILMGHWINQLLAQFPFTVTYYAERRD